LHEVVLIINGNHCAGRCGRPNDVLARLWSAFSHPHILTSLHHLPLNFTLSTQGQLHRRVLKLAKMRAATHEAALMARCATASMSTAVAGPSRSSTARHFSLLSKQRSALDHHSAAGLSGRNFDASSPGSRPLGCSCCGKKLVAPPASSQLRHASYSTRSPSGGRALMTSAAEKAPARSSPASAPAAEPSASQSSYQPPDLAITNPINPPKGGPPPGPFRGADIKDSSTAPRQDSIELEDNLPSTSSHSEEVAKDSTGACSTLSPSSPSAPRSQKSAAETSTTTTQKSATASAAAATATAPKRGGGAAFRPKKAALTLVSCFQHVPLASSH